MRLLDHEESWWFVTMIHHDDLPWRFIMMNHDDLLGYIIKMLNHDDHDESWWFILMNRDDSSWRTTMIRHDESWCFIAWFMIMNHNGSLWWILMLHNDDASWWFIMIHRTGRQGWLGKGGHRTHGRKTGHEGALPNKGLTVLAPQGSPKSMEIDNIQKWHVPRFLGSVLVSTEKWEGGSPRPQKMLKIQPRIQFSGIQS